MQPVEIYKHAETAARPCVWAQLFLSLLHVLATDWCRCMCRQVPSLHVP
jgi:hypothetical protein